MAHRRSIAGGAVFWGYLPPYFGIWYTWNGVAPGLMRLFFAALEGKGMG